jgi:phage I-like protein
VSQTFGYWVDLKDMKFDESEPAWIQAIPAGKYQHPVYGEMDFSTERLQRFAASVADKIRGQDLDIDYDHKADTKIASGWVKNAQVRSDGLYLQVDWTPAARAKLQAKEYRYFSPEFVDEWTHPKTQQVHKDVLCGGALTNRPFLKDILPINLSEVFEHAGDPMDPSKGKIKLDDAGAVKEFATSLGLKEDASNEEIVAAFKAKLEVNNVSITSEDKDKEKPELEPSTLSEEDLKNPAIKALADSVAAMQKKFDEQTTQVEILTAANKLAETDATLALLSNGSKVLTPAAKEAARSIMLDDATKRAENTKALLEMVLKGVAAVELGERGRSRTDSGTATGIKVFTDAVTKEMTENNKLSYVEATRKVAQEQPDLYTEYMGSLHAGEGGK